MADALLERVRGGYEAWNEGDLDSTLEFLHPDVEWHTSASFPGVEPDYEGHDGFRRFWEDLHEPWEGVRVELESYQREDDVATLRIRFHGRSKASGVDVELPWFQAIVIEDEKVRRSALDRSTTGALEALGLAERFPEF
jgi:ketosteroid isomerase-like protein